MIFSECITHLATRTFMKCNKRQNSVGDIKPNKHQKVLETIVKNATQMWCSNPIHLRNPLQFLQLSSHCINDVHMEASQIHFDTIDEHRVSANDDDERQFQLSKSNSNRKQKPAFTKDCKKTYVMTMSSEHIERIVVDEVPERQVPAISKAVSEKTVNKSEPPPLAFYPKNRGKQTQQPIMFSATEPPPLVPITRNFT